MNEFCYINQHKNQYIEKEILGIEKDHLERKLNHKKPIKRDFDTSIRISEFQIPNFIKEKTPKKKESKIILSKIEEPTDLKIILSELKVIQSIESRELLLSKLKNILNCQDINTSELSELLSKLREETLNVIQSIQNWSFNFRERKKFKWNNIDYIAKIEKIELKSALEKILGYSLEGNYFYFSLIELDNIPKQYRNALFYLSSLKKKPMRVSSNISYFDTIRRYSVSKPTPQVEEIKEINPQIRRARPKTAMIIKKDVKEEDEEDDDLINQIMILEAEKNSMRMKIAIIKKRIDELKDDIQEIEDKTRKKKKTQNIIECNKEYKKIINEINHLSKDVNINRCGSPILKISNKNRNVMNALINVL